MSEGKKYYCFCGSNCKYETMTKEQILTAIAQATGVTDVDPNAGFITKVKETNGRFVTFWVGTQAQYAIDAASIPAGTPVIITDDTDIDSVPTQGSDNPVTSGGVYNALARLDTTTGDIYFGQTRVVRVMDYDSYAALQTKDSIFYLTYPTPAQNSGRSLQTSPLAENENSEGEKVKETETKKSVEMEKSDEQLEKLPPFGFGGYDE